MRYVQTSSGDFVRHIRNEAVNIQWDATTNTSVRKLSEDQRVEFGVSRLKMVTPPSFDADTHTRAEGDAVLTDGVWAQNWVLTEEAEESKAINIRLTRDAKLELSDWRALSDTTMSAEWTTYRQALRDISAQAGFPNTITWPTEPS
jgi:hypothetical protein